MSIELLTSEWVPTLDFYLMQFQKFTRLLAVFMLLSGFSSQLFQKTALFI
jgi:hypothetical protein